MGVYYYYVNETKQEYFCIDPSGADIKSYALGRNIGSRALSYLLLQNDPDQTGVELHPLVGNWIGDRFFVTGDDYCPNFEEILSKYSDVGQSILEMIVAIEPYDLIQYGGVEWLIRLLELNGKPIEVSEEMRRRMLKCFRGENYLQKCEEIEAVISALRPRE